MSEPSMEQRMSALETEVTSLRRIVAGVDRDQSDQQQTINAIHHTVQATAINVSQLQEKLRGVLATQDEHSRILNQHGEQLTLLLQRSQRSEDLSRQILTILDRLVDGDTPSGEATT